jgi:hypothetical protein
MLHFKNSYFFIYFIATAIGLILSHYLSLDTSPLSTDSRNEISTLEYPRTKKNRFDIARANSYPVLAVKTPSTLPDLPKRRAVETPDGLVYVDFPMNPFPVTIRNSRHEWTQVDARSPKTINQLAHNDFEHIRLTREAAWVERRELVYRKETFRALAEAALARGEPLVEITLPGFNGEEFAVSINEWKVTTNDDGEKEGWLTGHLMDDPEAEVSLNFHGNREVGSVSSPSFGLHLRYDPREDGQIMVNRINLKAQNEATGSSRPPYSIMTVGKSPAIER